MKPLDKAFTLIIFALGLTFSSLVTAESRLHHRSNHAGNSYQHDYYRKNNHGHIRHHKKYRHQRKYHSHKPRYYRYSNHKAYNHHLSHKRRYSNNNKYYYHYGHNRKRSYKHTGHRHYSHYQKPCRQVTKTKYDEYGIPHQIAGTLCYDHRGEGYIVSGSRYHIN